MKVLICYYSTYGNVYKMANLVAEGVSQVAGAEPVVRTVPELIPAAVIESRADRHNPRRSALLGPGTVHHSGLGVHPTGRVIWLEETTRREIDPQEAAICRALG